jgi:hypothetical protein
MQIHNAAITGSFTYNGIDISDITGSEQSVTSLNEFSSSILNYTSSNNTNISALNAQSASFLAYTASNDAKITSLNTFSSSILSYTSSANTKFAGLDVASGSAITRLDSLEVASGSAITRLGALETASGSAITRLSSIESKTGSYATTGSNTFVDGQYLSSSFNPTGFSTTASLYTDGGLRVTRDAYISGTLYLNNVTVFGTQSVAYISSSQLNIGTNLITVNTDTPSIRFGGLAVYDSGSTGLTGSILWDSQNNHWVYSNPSGSSYSGGMFISGPRTSTLGSETGTTSCALMMGQGGDHITSSAILHYGNATCFYGTSFISSSGAACFAGSLTGSSAIFSSTLSATNLSAEGSPALGGIVSLRQDATYLPRGNGYSSIASSPSAFDFYGYTGVSTYKNFTFRFDGLTDNTRRDYTLPNACGTIALLSGTQNFTGTVCAPAFIGGTVDGTIINSTSNAFRFSGNNAISLVSLNAQNVVKINAAGYWGTQLVGANDKGILIDNTGLIGIGLINPSCYYSNQLVVSAGSEGGITIANPGTTGAQYIMFADGISGADRYRGYMSYNHTDNSMTLATDANTRFTITGTGIACFACQVCAPKLIATQLSATCLTLNSFSSGNGFKMDYGSASGEITAINLIANGTTNGFIGIQMVDGSNGDLWLGGSSNRSMTIYRTGNHGFNTNTPCTKVHVEGGYGSIWGGNGCFFGGGVSGGGFPYGDIYGNGASYTYQTACTNANNDGLYGGFAAGYFRGGDGGNYGGGGAGIVAIGGNGGNAESVNAGGGAGLFARAGKNGAGSVHSYAGWFDGGDVVIRCGNLHVAGNEYIAKSGGGGSFKQTVVGQTTAASSGTAKKIAYVGHTHSVRIYVWANQSTGNGSSAIADITTLYGSSNGGTTTEANFGNVSDIVVTYDNGGSPAYTINVSLTYSGAAPTINYIVEGISHDNSIYAIS